MDLGFGPGERLGVLMVGLDEAVDAGAQLSDRGEGGAGEGLVGRIENQISIWLELIHLQPFGFRDVHPAVLALPIVEGRLAIRPPRSWATYSNERGRQLRRPTISAAALFEIGCRSFLAIDACCIASIWPFSCANWAAFCLSPWTRNAAGQKMITAAVVATASFVAWLSCAPDAAAAAADTRWASAARCRQVND
jgi:hypothetical protein